MMSVIQELGTGGVGLSELGGAAIGLLVIREVLGFVKWMLGRRGEEDTQKELLQILRHLTEIARATKEDTRLLRQEAAHQHDLHASPKNLCAWADPATRRELSEGIAREVQGGKRG